MKTSLYILFVLLTLIHCNTDAPTKREIHLLNNSYHYRLPESGVTIRVPSEYLTMSVTDYTELIKESGLPAELITRQISKISNMKAKYPRSEFFLDTVGYENMLWILEADFYLPMRNNSANVAARMFLGNDLSEGTYIEHEELIEKKLIAKSWYKYIKLRTRQKYFEGKRYNSMYLISTQDKSFAINFLCFKNYDYSEVVNTIERIE